METNNFSRTKSGSRIMAHRNRTFQHAPDLLQDHFKHHMQQLPIAYFACDQYGYITYFNDEAVGFWGEEPIIGVDQWHWSWKLFDTKGKHISPDHCPIATCLKEQKASRAEILMIEKLDGTRCIAELRTQPVIDHNGKFIGTSNVVIDVSNFTNSNFGFLHSINEVEDILDTISDGFCAIDFNWIIKAWNKVAAINTGKAKEEMIGSDYRSTLCHYLSSADIQAMDVAMKAKKSIKFERNFPEKGLWLEFAAFPTSTGMHLFVKDIVEKKEQFQKVLKTKNNAASLINASDDLLWSVDKNFVLTAANNAYKNIIKSYFGIEVKEGDCVLIKETEGQQDSWKTYYERSLKGERFKVEAEPIGNSMSRVTEEIIFNPIYDVANDEIIGVACASRNITERREKEKLVCEHNKILSKKEKDLEKLTNDLEKIMNSSLDIICTIDDRGRFTRVSAASAKVWGYAPEELVGRDCMDFVVTDDKELTLKAANRIRRGTEMNHFENDFIRKDGVPLNMAWSAKWDSEAKTMFCVAKDATEIKKAERQKYEVEQRFLTLIQKGADMVAIVDKDGNYTYLSNNIERIIGFKQEELLGKNAFAFIHPDDVAKVSAALEELLHCTEVKMSDFRFKDGYGNWMWVEVIGTNMLGNESINGIVINSRNVTERKLQEEELRKSHERFEIVSKATNEFIWDYDIVSGDLYWNENYSKLFGYDKDSNNLQSWKQNIHPEDMEEICDFFNKVASGQNGRYWKGEYRYRKANGDYAYIFDQGYLLLDDKGEPTRFVGAMQDISARKEIENEKELIIEELTKSNNDLKQFSFITSHNLRAPLSNIQGILSLIKTDDLCSNNSEMFQYLKISTTQLQQTIKDLTDIIVIRDRPGIHTEEIDLPHLFNNVKENFLNTLHEIPHQLKTNFQLEKAVLNKSYIESIFTNLVSNAIKYRAKERSLEINISTYLSGHSNLVINFTDNGIGFDYERCKNRVFGMYQRFHNNVEGRGLGLFMVRSQVSSMGGTIKLESEINEGTRFIIELPLNNLKGMLDERS